MSLYRDFHRIIRQVCQAVAVPKIEEVLLPTLKEEGKQDEFGFIVLADGSVGPFYTSLGDSLSSLHRRTTEVDCSGKDPIDLALKLGDGRLHSGALALGAVNAISQFLMHRAGFDPTVATVETVLPEPNDSIGMVGFFGPVVERYLARGCRITVVEKKPERVPIELGIEVSTNPAALRGCDHIVCTASTLINNTLEEILGNLSQDSTVNLMGPSASCLPDPLFARGIDLVGGILIDDPECLRRAMILGDSWGCCGKKYQLSAEHYPGVEALLASIEQV